MHVPEQWGFTLGGSDMTRLSIELIPTNSFGRNLRSLLRGCTWDRLRFHTYWMKEHRCEVCGDDGEERMRGKHVTVANPARLECHEKWLYDEKNRIQRLIGLEALCPLCHQCKHIGRTLSVGAGERAIRHLARVNRFTLRQAEALINEAMIQHVKRSAGPRWTLDLSWLQNHCALTEQDKLDLPIDDRGIHKGTVATEE